MRAARRIVTVLGVACCLWGALGATATAATPATPSPTSGPCAGSAVLVAQSFTPPSVLPGGQSSEGVTIMNCGSAALTIHLQWTARWSGADGGTVPAGCPIVDPVLTPVTLPADGSTTTSLRYSVPAACTATSLTGTVSATDVNGLSGSAVLQISGSADCPAGAAITAQSFTPSAVPAGGSATENVTVRNCGSAALSTDVQWYALPAASSGGSGLPAGCVVYDPVLTPVSIPAGGSVTLSRRYAVPATCTATALTATVSLPRLPGTPSGTAVLAITPPACTATVVQHTWPGGFTLTVTITNQGPALTGWTADYTFGGDQQVTNSWSAAVTQVGASVTAVNAPWNGALATGGSTSFGSNGSWRVSSAPPSALRLNGHPCTTTVTVT